jgi:methionine aminopeptidase
MRAAGRVAADTLDLITTYVKPGISTAKLDRLCEKLMRAAGSIPATIDYSGYKHASGISLNNVVTHGVLGIPDQRYRGFGTNVTDFGVRPERRCIASEWY